jgi:transposase
VTQLPNLDHLSHAEKDELIRALWAQVQELRQRVAELESQLGGPPKTLNNSSLSPSKGQKPNFDEKPKREGPRKGSLGRKGGGRALEAHPNETVVAQPVCCAHCRAAFLEADLKLSAVYDKIDLPPVKPVVTRVERYTGHCQHCGSTTVAPVPEGLEPGTPFSINFEYAAENIPPCQQIALQSTASIDIGFWACRTQKIDTVWRPTMRAATPQGTLPFRAI